MCMYVSAALIVRCACPDQWASIREQASPAFITHTSPNLQHSCNLRCFFFADTTHRCPMTLHSRPYERFCVLDPAESIFHAANDPALFEPDADPASSRAGLVLAVPPSSHWRSTAGPRRQAADALGLSANDGGGHHVRTAPRAAGHHPNQPCRLDIATNSLDSSRRSDPSRLLGDPLVFAHTFVEPALSQPSYGAFRCVGASAF